MDENSKVKPVKNSVKEITQSVIAAIMLALVKFVFVLSIVKLKLTASPIPTGASSVPIPGFVPKMRAVITNSSDNAIKMLPAAKPVTAAVAAYKASTGDAPAPACIIPPIPLPVSIEPTMR